MSEGTGKRGLKSYVATLVATVLFPVVWMQALRLARNHADQDPRARAKILAAIAISLGIAVVGGSVVLGFVNNAETGIYASMGDRLATAVGESEYQDQLSAAETAQKSIGIIEGNLANATDDARRAELQTALDAQRAALAAARARSSELADNHAKFLEIADAVQAGDDARIRMLVGEVPAFTDLSTSKFPKFADVQENADHAFAVKNQSVDDLQLFAFLFLWPSLVGAFFAPLAFALGSVLRKAFVPSDTVGFKPYPGAAAGLFLLLGAFGVPSLLFAAWTFNDAFGRAEEGQIAL